MTNAELNIAVAEKVMGWKLVDRVAMGWGEGPDCFATGQDGDDESPTRQWFEPATDIKSAWEVVEKMEAQKRHVGIRKGGRAWRVYFDDSDVTTSESVCEAICLAALKAVSGEGE